MNTMDNSPKPELKSSDIVTIWCASLGTKHHNLSQRGTQQMTWTEGEETQETQRAETTNITLTFLSPPRCVSIFRPYRGRLKFADYHPRDRGTPWAGIQMVMFMSHPRST